MTYDIRIENRGARDILITGVDEKSIGETIARWCGGHTTIVVTQSEDKNDGQ